jgi:MYXO-CTERM domain-containing protein
MRRPELGPSEPAAAVRPSATASDPAATATPDVGLELGLGALALGGLVAAVLLRRRRGGAGAAGATAPSAPKAPDAVELELQEMLAEAAARRSAEAAPEPTAEQGTRGPR